MKSFKEWCLENEKNEKNEKNPTEYLPLSEEKLWWKCEKGHEWQASICNRTKGQSCPICWKKRCNKKDCNEKNI